MEPVKLLISQKAVWPHSLCSPCQDMLHWQCWKSAELGKLHCNYDSKNRFQISHKCYTFYTFQYKLRSKACF